MSKKTTKLGIDLGTTNSCCYCIRPNEDRAVVPTHEGANLLISSPLYQKGKGSVFGKNCTNAIKYGKRTMARYPKRLIGKKLSDLEVLDVSKFCGAPIIDRGDGYPCYDLSDVEEGMRKTPEEVSTEILSCMIERAKVFNELEIEEICITIPARFDNNQRTATINALKNCGFDEDHIKVISEPCAAAITYIHDNPGHKEHILIFDFGGGTFDVSIVHVSEGKMCVEAYRGDNNIGGLTIDMKLVEWIKRKYFERHNIVIPDNWRNRNIATKLLILAKGVKESLSVEEEAKIPLDDIIVNRRAFDSDNESDDDDNDDDDDNEISITRSEFENLIQDIPERILEVVGECIQAAGLKKTDISDVVFVGGSTRMPCIREAVQRYFSMETTNLRDSVNPDECVANGALLYFDTDIIISDRTSYSFGHLVNGTKCECIIPMDSPLPARETVENTIAAPVSELYLRLFQGNATRIKQRERIRDCISVGNYSVSLEDFMQEYDLEYEDMEGRVIETTYTIQRAGKIIITVRDKASGYVLVNNCVIEYQSR